MKDMSSTNPPIHKPTPKILFVCLGNICRSPAAQAVMERLAPEWEIDSAGTGAYHIGEQPDKRMRVHAFQRGIPLQHVCRQVCDDDFDRFDLIIGMDASNIASLKRMAPSLQAQAKVHAMAEYFSPGARFDHVPDPYYEGAEGFELVLDLLEDGCRNLYETLSV